MEDKSSLFFNPNIEKPLKHTKKNRKSNSFKKKKKKIS